MNKDLIETPIQSVPSFMQKAALSLQQEISRSQAQNPLQLSSLSKTIGLISLVGILLVLALLTWLIQRERTRLAKFRDQIRVTDLKLIQQALEKFYRAQGYYPPVKDSEEFRKVIKRASQNKRPLEYEVKPSFLLRLIRGAGQTKLYQKLIGSTLDSQEVADPREGEKLPGTTEHVFSYYYSSQGLNWKRPGVKPGTSYRLWCYLEATKGNKTREGFNVFELS